MERGFHWNHIHPTALFMSKNQVIFVLNRSQLKLIIPGLMIRVLEILIHFPSFPKWKLFGILIPVFRNSRYNSFLNIVELMCFYSYISSVRWKSPSNPPDITSIGIAYQTGWFFYGNLIEFFLFLAESCNTRQLFGGDKRNEIVPLLLSPGWFNRKYGGRSHDNYTTSCYLLDNMGLSSWPGVEHFIESPKYCFFTLTGPLLPRFVIPFWCQSSS